MKSLGRPFNSNVKLSVSLNEDVNTSLPALRARFSHAAQIPEDLSGIDFIYLPLNAPFDAAGPLTNAHRVFGIELPRVIYHGESEAVEKLKAWKERGAAATLCPTLSGLELALKAKLPAHAGAFMNLFNSKAVSVLYERYDLADVTLSYELPLREIRKKAPRGVLWISADDGDPGLSHQNGSGLRRM